LGDQDRFHFEARIASEQGRGKNVVASGRPQGHEPTRSLPTGIGEDWLELARFVSTVDLVNPVIAFDPKLLAPACDDLQLFDVGDADLHGPETLLKR
jgi:hypothetical protein